MLQQTSLVVSGSHGQPMAQPLIRIGRAAAQQIVDLATQFGLHEAGSQALRRARQENLAGCLLMVVIDV